ncbi:MAG: ATP synthase F1 subunit delta [Coriobacteriia bacterium]|nr:ATP synthase F1 subunit delta [Coriobacteriia bacterium]MBN2823387.1 ATP synthase F1 subunit delta [Coriobacteriia bacterium]
MRTSETVETLARVLFDLASLADATEAVDGDLASVVTAVRGHMDLRQALTDTGIPVEKKRDVLRDIFGGTVSPEALSIVTLMVERGMTDQLGELKRVYSEISERESGVVVAEVTTAIPLDDDLRAKLVEKLSASLGRSVSLRERVDESIIGGVRISVAGKVLDGSVSTQLRSLRTVLSTAHQGGEA